MKQLPLSPGNPLPEFAENFRLKQNQLGELSFGAIINLMVQGKVHKIQSKVHITSKKRLMDMVVFETMGMHSLVFPTEFREGTDVFTYLPNECLMINGNNAVYGHYNIVVYPELISVVAD